MEESESRLNKLIDIRGSDYAAAISLNNLTTEEALIISDYADLFGSEINRKLIQETNIKEDLDNEKLLNQALDKLESYDMLTVHVDFGVDEDEEDEIYEWFEERVGNVIQFPNFLGSTKNKEKFKNRNFYLKIITCSNSSGKFITPLTGKKLEEEVLFKSKSNFKIQKVNRGGSTVELLEVDRNNAPSNILTELYYLNQKD